MEVSPLPLREEDPPREAKVAADKLETVRAPYNHTALKMVKAFFFFIDTSLCVCSLGFWMGFVVGFLFVCF